MAKYHRWREYMFAPSKPSPLEPADAAPAVNPHADLIAMLEAEPTWNPATEQAQLSYVGYADARSVYLGQRPCQFCAGWGSVTVKYTGATTGKQVLSTLPCTCVRNRLYFGNIDPLVPDMYKGVDLRTISPRVNENLSLARQTEIIEFIQKHSSDGYLLLGPPRVGKTHLLMGLLSTVGRRWAHNTWMKGGTPWPAVWYYHASALLREHVAYVSNRVKNPETAEPPKLTVASIKSAVRNNHKPWLALDDLHKVAPTPFQLEVLHDLVDTIHENNGTVVAVSNEDVPWFRDRWGTNNADAIFGRILEKDAHRVWFADRKGKVR